MKYFPDEKLTLPVEFIFCFYLDSQHMFSQVSKNDTCPIIYDVIKRRQIGRHFYHFIENYREKYLKNHEKKGHPTDLFCKTCVLGEVQPASRFSNQIKLIKL